MSPTRPNSPVGHVCMPFDDPAEFEDAARAFLAAGAARGEFVRYVADRPPTGWDFDAEFARPADQYPAGTTVDGPATVAAFTTANDAVLAEGWTGLRVAADVTDLVRTPAQVEAFARYEHQIDRHMRGRPLRGMCGLDRRVIDDATIADLACLHPDAESEFRLYAAPIPEHRHGDLPDGVALAGEIDVRTRFRFAVALDRAGPRPVGGELVVDAPRLTFIDHATLQLLDHYAHRNDAVAVLRTPFTAAARVVSMLNLTGVRVETVR